VEVLLGDRNRIDLKYFVNYGGHRKEDWDWGEKNKKTKRGRKDEMGRFFGAS